jgi:hypothetical protein
MKLSLGTRSVLYGAHAFYLHPWFVALSWWKLYGFPWDPRLWVAFFVHDLGYIGKPNMDGEEGEMHPLLGARIMSALFDRKRPHVVSADCTAPLHRLGQWGMFTLTHSRYLAKRLGVQPSRLCIADKLALGITPAWLYLPMVKATGEIAEYLDRAHRRAASNEQLSGEERTAVTSNTPEVWFAGVQAYMHRWVAEHRDGKADTWTGSQRTESANGVWS